MPRDLLAPQPRDLLEGRASTQPPSAEPPSFLDSVGRGMLDPLDAFGQMAMRVAPSILPEGPLRDRLVQAQKDYETKISELAGEYQRSRGPGAGFDYGRLTGNVAATLPLAAAVPGAAAPSLAARIPAAMAGGAMTGALQPTEGEPDDFWEQKAGQAAMGAGLAGATTGVLGAVGRIGRLTSGGRAASALSKEGVTPTLGQRAGGIVRAAEEKAKSVPVVGGAIRSAERTAIDSFNKSTANRALKHIGEKLSKGTNAGYELVAEVHKKASAAYKTALPNADTPVDMVFRRDMASLRKLVDELPEGAARQFDNILKNRLYDKIPGSNVLTGQSGKSAVSELGRLAAQYGRSADGEQRLLGDALREAQASISRMVSRAHPGTAKAIKAADKAWAEYLRIQRAAGYVGSEEGVFSPAQYRNAVVAMDRSFRKGAVSEGRAVGQRFADQGRTALTSRVPNSGTADRAAMIGWPLSVGGALAGQQYPLAALLAGGPVIAAGGYAAANKLAPLLASHGRYATPALAAGSGLLAPQLAP